MNRPSLYTRYNVYDTGTKEGNLGPLNQIHTVGSTTGLVQVTFGQQVIKNTKQREENMQYAVRHSSSERFALLP